MALKKIAVLGGGLSSITAVYKITADPNWTDLYDITVYQIGWRLIIEFGLMIILFEPVLFRFLIKSEEVIGISLDLIIGKM